MVHKPVAKKRPGAQDGPNLRSKRADLLHEVPAHRKAENTDAPDRLRRPHGDLGGNLSLSAISSGNEGLAIIASF